MGERKVDTRVENSLQTNHYTGSVNKGLEGVVVCKTAISRIKNGALFYRGFAIEDLAKNSHFEEVLFLLWNDKLPTASELKEFRRTLNSNLKLETPFFKALKALPTKNVHPMAWLRTAISFLALHEKDSESLEEEKVKKIAFSLTARVGQLMALFERLRQGQEYVPPLEEKSLAWNFLYSLTGKEPSSEEEKIFDTCLILHADHEMNCSTFSARVTGSSLSDVFSSIVSAIGTLKGPLHGGANEQVMKTLKKIGSPGRAKTWLKEALLLKKKIMGFGHRVYKDGDPRAKILREMSKKITHKTSQSKWFEISQILEEEMKKAKGLLPNVDFYSATVYYSMGIPLDLYTPIFAVSRMGGWLAHLIEQMTYNRIYRPLSEWIGKDHLKWVPADKRT